MSEFVLTLFLLGYVWWPLAEEYLSYIPWDGEWWRYMDWLLILIFLFMSLTIMANADIKKDIRIIFIGLIGGLVIESWGTQTEIWTYYTNERPPLWIIPAWPIASLSIDRMVRLVDRYLPGRSSEQDHRIPLIKRGWISKDAFWQALYWISFIAYFALLVQYASPTLDKSFTVIAITLVAGIILTPTDYRFAAITFLAGSGLGYYLEVWGTTREAWTYYTLETPPIFAVFSHGIAAVAFWRGVRYLDQALSWLTKKSAPTEFKEGASS